MRPWSKIVSEDEEGIYKTIGFGGASGLGRRPALVIIDVQYRTAGETPMPISEAIKQFPSACGQAAWDAIAQIKLLLAEFRRKKLPVIYAYVAKKETYDAGRLGEKMPALMGISDRGYEFVKEIEPIAGEILLPKRHPSAFFGTPLASYLVDQRADSLVMTGCTTSGCVRASTVDGFAYNYRMTVPEDAVYDRIPTSHAVNLFDMASKFADVKPTKLVLESLAAL
jgi:maleamate amidohydrolase